jgi:superfamily I DNA/RNA helicase
MLADGLNPKQKEKVTQQDLPDLIKESSLAFIKTAKDYLLTPELLEKKLESSFLRSNPLMKMGLEIYRDYQNALQYRAAVDFADLIRLAYQCLREDPSLTSLLQYRWPYILEDEAQDSSLLQEKSCGSWLAPTGTGCAWATQSGNLPELYDCKSESAEIFSERRGCPQRTAARIRTLLP